MTTKRLMNYLDGEWVESSAEDMLIVENPATRETLAEVPLSDKEEVAMAVDAASQAFPEWRETPPYARARYMFRLKELMEDRFEDLARVIVKEHGKIIDEARGEVRRAIENVEVAAGVPTLMMGYNMEDVSSGIDEEAVLQPVGVFACIAPFNFPLMVPMWFLPYAIVTGNTYIVKPSERCPMSQNLLFELLDEIDLPPGVVNLVNGDRIAVEALLAHQSVRGISFVGSTPVGKHLYAQAASFGKRAQVQGGAKNCLVVMPDANLEKSVPNIISSAFGTGGQRCLAGSLVIAVGGVADELKEHLVSIASRMKLGNGLDEATQMGPVVSGKSLQRITEYIEKGQSEGASLLLDGRNASVDQYPQGYFIGPSIFEGVKPDMTIAREEIFGPVLGIIEVDDFNQAVEVINQSPYGNAASIYTRSGGAAREFKYRVQAGNVGINIGIAAPVASFPFSGMKDSFFGDLHGQGLDGIQFFTDRKVVISRWLED